MHPVNRKKGIIFVLLSGLFFGFIGFFGMQVLNADFTVNTLLFWRFLVSALFMGGMVLLHPSQLHFPLKKTIKPLVSGFLLYGPSSAMYFVAAKEIGSGVAMVLFFTFPAMVMFFNQVFFKHEVSKMYYVAIAIMILGLLCLMQSHGEGMHLNLMGVLISLLSALLFAIYITANHKCELPATVGTLLICIGSALSAYLVAVFLGDFAVPHTQWLWFNVIGIAVVCTAIPILLLLKGLKNIGSLEASILSVLEPVFVVLFGILLLGETLSFFQWTGVVLLLAGAFFALLTEN